MIKAVLFDFFGVISDEVAPPWFSRYFGEADYHYMVDGKADGYKFVGEPNPNPENKQLLIIPGASHCDLYDGGYTELEGKGKPKNMIPWDKLAEFFASYLK